MTPAESLSTLGAGKFQAGFKVYDSNGALCKINVLNFQSQGLADSAAEVEEHPNKQLVSQI